MVDIQYLTRVNPDAIPDELKPHRNFCNWTPQERGNGKIAKCPLTPNTLRKASIANPLTFGTLREAMLARSRSRTPLGIEYMLNGKGNLVMVDLDGCFTPSGMLKGYAAIIIERLNTYTEKSPSGNGIRMFCRGFIPENCKGELIEIYNRQPATLTGDIYGEPKGIRECPTDITAICYQYFPEKMEAPRPIKTILPAAYQPDPNIDNVISKICSDPARAALFHGDMSAYANDHSRADLALCNHIIYWGNYTDIDSVDRVFRRSGLYRPKWDSIHTADGLTYGQWTIRKAFGKRGA